MNDAPERRRAKTAAGVPAKHARSASQPKPPGRPGGIPIGAPSVPVPALTDAQIDELTERLERLPAPLEPLDTSMLDGFLCGVLVQPKAIDERHWWPFVIDAEGRTPKRAVDVAALRALVMQRHRFLQQAIGARQWFDPWVFDDAADRDDGEDAGAGGVGADVDGDDADGAVIAVGVAPRRDRPVDDVDADARPDADADDDASPDDDDDATAAIVAAVHPWVIGFVTALEVFPALMAIEAGKLNGPLALLYRFLSPDDLEDADDVLDEIDNLPAIVELGDAVEGLVRATLLLADVAAEH